MKVVIMAGGRGTRIAPVQDHVPKPMIPIAKRPVIEYGIRCLARQGYTDITLVVGYLGRIIQDYFGDGSKFGVSLTYFVEKEPLGTAGALFRMYAAGMIQEDFFLINGDIMLDIDFRRMEEYHRKKGGYGTIFTHPNSHPQDSALIFADSEKRIVRWLNKEDERTLYKKPGQCGDTYYIAPITER